VPFLRSDAQARILAALLLDAGHEASITELAAVAGIAQPNASREVNRLVQAGILHDRQVGRSRMVSAELESPYFEPLAQILARSYGPVRVIHDELRTVPGIAEVVIFGSYAARYQGQMGTPPRDIDVLVVGDPPGRLMRRANARMEETIGMTVQITTVSLDQWHDAATGFLHDVQSKPMIPLDLNLDPPVSFLMAVDRVSLV